MNPRPNNQDPAFEAAPAAAPEASQELVNPKLSASLSADYEALQNDMQQAQELAADFQRQLAGKSNEFAQLKQLFEKTQKDLTHLQTGIAELRAERHRLANEAMRAAAFEMKLAKMTEERDRLRADMAIMQANLAKASESGSVGIRERDAMIVSLVKELETLKLELSDARRANGEVPMARRPVHEPRPHNSARPIPTRLTPPKPAPIEEFIDIVFEA